MKTCAILVALICVLCSAGVAVAQEDWNWKEGRSDMTLLVEGKVDQVIANLLERQKESPQHGEIFFGLAVAYAQKGNIDEAMTNVRHALESGLPIERFHAGPREMLKPLTESKAFRNLAAQSPSQLLHGPLLGSVTGSSARFWIRTKDAVPFQVSVRDKETGKIVASGTGATLPVRDFTGVCEVGGLKPATMYDYTLQVNGVEQTNKWSFKTFPEQGKGARFRIAFGGGAAYTPDYERMFSVVASREPVAFLQLGDNVYIDQPRLTPIQEYCYYRRQSSAPYRALVASVNIAAIYDDHDFFDDDSWGGPEIDSPAWKRPVWETFRKNWNNPYYGGGDAQPGCNFDFQIGDVHFIMLDCRYYRVGPKQKEGRSMLGPVGKKWLFDTLKKSKGTFKVIASSVPFSEGVKPGSKDPWDGYPEEREEIFSFIEKEKVEGVLLIAADRHRSDIWKTDRPNGYPLYEFQSSRLTNIHMHPVMKGSIFGYNERSFATIDFDTTKKDPTVGLTIVNIDGETVYEMELKRSELGF